MIRRRSFRAAWAAGFFWLAPIALHAQGQWTIAMRAMHNPLALGQCTAIEIVPKDARGYPPVRPDGKQVSWQDFDLSFTSSAPDAFAWQPPANRFLCARAPTAGTAIVVAHYPGAALKPMERVPGVDIQQSVQVLMQGVPQAPDPTLAGAAPAGGQPYPSGAYPVSANPGSAYPPSGYPTTDPSAGYAPGTGMAPAGAWTGTQPDTSRVRNGKQFVQRVTGHAKRKAGDVASETATHVADAANDVVDTTLESGSQLATAPVDAAKNAATSGVTGTGRDPHDAKGIAAALAGGRVVLRQIRFVSGTANLDPASGSLIGQLAQAIAATPGQYLIEGHVDKKEGPLAQPLSEQRAAAVKAALVSAGISPTQLVAAGYGSSRPIGGAGGSARIEVARTQ